MSPMTMLMVFGGIVCGWTMLSVLSGERSRRVRQIEAEIEAASAEPPPPGIPIATSPTHQSRKLLVKPLTTSKGK